MPEKNKIEIIDSKVKPEAQYDDIAKEYSDLAEIDPSKKYVQYPAALKLLGEIKEKDILDIGCGDGIFTRQLARNGARVVGYDISDKQIEKANKMEMIEKNSIDFEIAGPETFSRDMKFDKAVSVLVLLYANSRKELKEFFLSAYKHLKDNTEFALITYNPNFKRLGNTAYNRKFSKTDNGEMKVEFFNNKNKQNFSALFSDFSIQDYENAAEEAGFKELRWENLKVEEEGKNKMGEEFWSGYEEDCPYIGLVAKK